METPKTQAIKAAYREHWDKVKDYVNMDNGIAEVPSSVNRTEFIKNFKLIATWPDAEGFKQMLIPYSLEGIENNRGWTRIESEEDLPKDDYFGDLFEVGFLDESGFFHHDRKRCSFKSLKWMYEKKLITHYQLVEKPKPPIF
ncbi:hypothetical protein [Elizabethkingia anophelis]|uniref:hypothetical protein n=1 Tax=Elizabethkingia anophelis TaxID=1117645 RepID=UPI0016270DFD|nr:hypothetical protein [Elizabethkingia anophelis]